MSTISGSIYFQATDIYYETGNYYTISSSVYSSNITNINLYNNFLKINNLNLIEKSKLNYLI